MPINEKLTALEERINKLRWCVVALQGNQGFKEAINSNTLTIAAENITDLFALLQMLIRKNQSVIPGLNRYLADVTKIAEEVSRIASNEYNKFAHPNLYMQRLISAFEAFTSSVSSEQTRQRLRRVASFMPVINDVVAACGGIPYYFEHANTREKVAMILCATLLVTALALTIAVYASPAVAAVPLLWPAITACMLLAKVLYDQASFNAKKKYEEKPKIEKVAEKLNKVKEDMQTYQRKMFPVQVDTDRKTMDQAVKVLNAFVDETAHKANAQRSLFVKGARKVKKPDPYRVSALKSKKHRFDKDNGKS